MKATIAMNVMGIFAYSEAEELVDQVSFPKDAWETAERLRKAETGEPTEEIVTLVKRLRKKGYTTFLFENAKIAHRLRDQLDINVEVEASSQAGESMRRNLEELAVDIGFVKQAEQFRQWVHNVTMELTKIRVRRATGKRDLLVVQVIQTIDDIDKTLNLFMSRIREWYGLHFPELDRLLDKHETYSRLVARLGKRQEFTAENLESEGLPAAKAKAVVKAASASMGAEIDDADIEQIQAMCRNTLALYDLRNSLEVYLEPTMKEVAPNIRAVAGALLGARLIALAGGLANLAKMPSSTIQVLGAEKALFRALRTGARPPKHGIVFQHPLLHEAKGWQRGKVARALAGKLAIAARSDAYTSKYRGDELKAGLDDRVEEIQEKYREAPSKKRPSKKPRRRTKRGRRR